MLRAIVFYLLLAPTVALGDVQIQTPNGNGIVNQPEVIIAGKASDPGDGTIHVFVRPLTGDNQPWYRQNPSQVDRSTGLFVSFATIGDEATRNGTKFAIKAVKLPPGDRPDRVVRRLPRGASSKIIVITKGDKSKIKNALDVNGGAEISIGEEESAGRQVFVEGKLNVPGWPVLAVHPLASDGESTINTWFVQRPVESYDQDNGEFSSYVTLGESGGRKRFVVLVFVVESEEAALDLKSGAEIPLGELPSRSISRPLVVTATD